jgi:hypothetical protein
MSSLRAYELSQIIHDSMATKGYGSMPVTVVVQGKIYSITEVTWCVKYNQFHIHTEDDELGFVE